MRARYIPGQGFEVERAGYVHLFSYREAQAVSPLFEAELYQVLVAAQRAPWVWQEE